MFVTQLWIDMSEKLSHESVKTTFLLGKYRVVYLLKQDKFGKTLCRPNQWREGQFKNKALGQEGRSLMSSEGNASDNTS